MSDTPRTDLWLEQHICTPTDDEVSAWFARELERECNQLKADWNKACDEQGFLMLECDGHRAKAAKLRKALQSVMDWWSRPEYWEYSIVFNFLCGKLHKNKKPRKLINTKLVED